MEGYIFYFLPLVLFIGGILVGFLFRDLHIIHKNNEQGNNLINFFKFIRLLCNILLSTILISVILYMINNFDNEKIYTAIMEWSPTVMASIITVIGVGITVMISYCQFKKQEINKIELNKKQEYKKHVTDNRMNWLIRMKENCSKLLSYAEIKLEENYKILMLECSDKNIKAEINRISNGIIFDLNPCKDKKYIDYVKSFTEKIIYLDKLMTDKDIELFRNSFNLMFKAEWDCIKDEVEGKNIGENYKDDKYKEVQKKMMKKLKKNEQFLKRYIERVNCNVSDLDKYPKIEENSKEISEDENYSSKDILSIFIKDHIN